MNSFVDEPKLEPVILPDEWTCPITQLVVPKRPLENLQYRQRLLTLAESDVAMQEQLYTACSQSILFYANAFCFTLRIFENDNGKLQQAENKHLPYLTWPIQDRHILKLEQGVDEGLSLLTDKSRDMGATWDHVVMYTHRFLFREDESHLLLSRKEDCVDLLDGMIKDYPHGNLSDPGTLFGKIDYILSRLPAWMLPGMLRKKMHLVNLDNKTRIDGESSNPTAGSSDRRTSIMLDEMAKMEEGEAIKRSTKDVTACRLPCSTPNGAGTAYSKWRLSGTIPVFVMGWWEHPEKSHGLYSKQDELGRWQLRSPWYDKRCEEDSPKEVAQEIDMDHIGSGDTFFEATIIEQHRKMFACPPKRVSSIVLQKKNMTDELLKQAMAKREQKYIVHTGGGPWEIWATLDSHSRPDQSKTYVISADISKGQGASNSCMHITCVEMREKIAAYADANTPPYELARLAIAAAIWCGGRMGLPLIIWENNGDPGFDFGRQLCQVYNYPNVYFDHAAGTIREKVGKRYGWRSSPEKKAAALGLLRRAYAHGRYRNHDGDSLTEALSYVHYEGGGIGPADLVEESDSNRSSHGDRVIADMLALVAIEKGGMRPAPPADPQNSIGFRMKQHILEKKRNDPNGRFPKRFNFLVN